MVDSVSITDVNSRRRSKREKSQPRKRALTSQHHPAKHRVVPVQGAAVPAVMSELVLALPDPLFGSLAYGLHQVRVALAQLALLVHQAGNVVADHAGTQRADVPEMGRSNRKLRRAGHQDATEILFFLLFSSVQVHSVVLSVNANAYANAALKR